MKKSDFNFTIRETTTTAPVELVYKQNNGRYFVWHVCHDFELFEKYEAGKATLKDLQELRKICLKYGVPFTAAGAVDFKSKRI